jgi:cytochrome c-type biogenesis protein
MASFGNQYSFIIAAVFIFIVAALVLFGRKARWQELFSLGVIGLGLILAWVVLHPVQTPLMGNAQKVQAMIGQGKPVLLEFQSPYCLGCTRMKPIIDKLEADNQDTLLVIRLNVQDAVGRELAAHYGFKFTPTFIFFDAQGNELWRSVGTIDLERVRTSLE